MRIEITRETGYTIRVDGYPYSTEDNPLAVLRAVAEILEDHALYVRGAPIIEDPSKET